MAKREALPTKIRMQILGEYNHKCAICGQANPQVHHIDQNPSNNEIDNLLMGAEYV